MSQQELFDYVVNTPHNTNPVILKQLIKGISGASSWNDLTDKPFGEEVGVILPETELTINEEYGFFLIPEVLPLEVGKVYTVIFNGEKYECEYLCVEENGEPMYIVGNGALFGGAGADTGEPFGIALAEGIMALFAGDLLSCTIAISGETIVPIPEKYLPEIPFFDLAAMGLPAVAVGSSATVDNVDLTEVFAAMSKGAIKVKLQVNVGTVVELESVLNPTGIVGSGQVGSTVLLFSDGTLVAVEVTFNSNGRIYVGSKIVPTT